MDYGTIDLENLKKFKNMDYNFLISSSPIPTTIYSASMFGGGGNSVIAYSCP
jgi:hypothetical protein